MLLSIVTIHLNDLEGLSRTIASVQRVLADPQVEWMFVDGGSIRETVGEKEIFERAQDLSSAFVSEPDGGIYDAMNKGTRMATGKYVLYLNAGDELHESFDFGQMNSLLKKSQASMLMGRCVERYRNGNEVELNTRSPAWAWYGMPASHPAILFRRELLGEQPYDTGFRIAADYDLYCRLLNSSESPVQRIPMVISRFYLGGVSDNAHAQTLSEEHRVRVRYFSVPGLVSRLIMVFKTLMKKLAAITWLRRLWRKWV